MGPFPFLRIHRLVPGLGRRVLCGQLQALAVLYRWLTVRRCVRRQDRNVCDFARRAVLRRFSVQSLLESIEGRIDRGGARNMYHASAFLSPHAYLWAASADTSSWQPHCWRSASERGVPSIGRRDWKSDLPFAVISFGLLVWSVLVSVTIMMLAFPFLLLCGVSGVIAAATPSERRCKLYLFAAIAIFLVAAGPAAYFLGTVLDTAAIFFPQELANNRASFYFASILFHWYSVGPVGPLLVIFAILGATLTAFDRGRSTLRIFGITLLTYLGTRLTFAVLVIVFDFWRGPAALYFEFYVIPLYAVFAALFFARVFGPLWRCLFGSLPSGWRVRSWSIWHGDSNRLGARGEQIRAELRISIPTEGDRDYGHTCPRKRTAAGLCVPRPHRKHDRNID